MKTDIMITRDSWFALLFAFLCFPNARARGSPGSLVRTTCFDVRLPSDEWVCQNIFAYYKVCGHSQSIPSRQKVDFLTFCRLGWRGVHPGAQEMIFCRLGFVNWARAY